jgi:hypothetical protein
MGWFTAKVIFLFQLQKELRGSFQKSITGAGYGSENIKFNITNMKTEPFIW